MSLTKNFNNTSLIKLDANAQKYWDYSFPNYTPETACKYLTKGLPEGTDLQIDFYEQKEWRSIILTNTTEKYDFTFQYMSDPNSVEFSSGDVCKGRGQGIAKTISRNAFEFFKKNGAENISVCAVSMGPYTWSRMGFIPYQSEWEEIQPMLHQRLDSVTALIQDKGIKEDVKYINELRDIIDCKDPKSVWKIADETSPYPASPKLSWGKVLLFNEKYLPRDVRPYIYNKTLGVSYTGHISLYDTDNMQRVCNYLYRPNETKILMEGIASLSKVAESCKILSL